MKISKISFNTSINNNFCTKKIAKNVTLPIGTKQNEPKIFSNFLGRDLVSFGSKTFDETLKANWFQLPSEFSPDLFQVEAGEALNDGKDVLVEAPTGTGKTAIAYYAASKNLDEGKTTFYTTPLKALSNQKLNEFRKIFGEENVGILTGDRRENAEAPIVIMTTEVYRNMALSNMYGTQNPLMKNLGTVIFDEYHYLGDDSRGPVWEESIMLTPKDVQILGLSATIGNPKDLAKWQSSLKGEEIALVSMPPEARAVPLTFDSIYTDAYEQEDKRIKKFGTVQQLTENYIPPKPKLNDFNLTVQKLNAEEKIPAIFFVFSRKNSRELLEHFEQNGQDLTTENEKKEIEKIVKKYEDAGYVGSDLNIEALKKGYAIHNAGIIPIQKKLIEELFQKKLTKVVIATETLAAGINMPAKTVVISSPYKPTDVENQEEEKRIRLLTSNEFKQMAGRAGRRGIDTQGFVYTMPVDKTTEQDFIYLEVAESNPLKSNYEPDYAFLSGYYNNNQSEEKLKDFIAKSFYAYDSDEKVRQEKIEELRELSKKRKKILVKRNFLNADETGIKPTIRGLMASVVKGYNAIVLSELIESKKLEGITPEALALLSGAIANPAKSDDGVLTVGTDVSYIFDSSMDYINSIYSNIHSSVASKLQKLGKNITQFDSYENMLKFAESIEKPDVGAEEISAELKKINDIRAKMYIITKTTGKMSATELKAALQKGETIPTKILQDNLTALEQYKKRINARTIEDYIDKLTRELEDNTSAGKGKKAKARLDKKCEDIQKDINTAKAMQYLEEHLYSAISSNYSFIRKYPPQEIRNKYNEYEKLLTKLTSKDVLISQIKALIGIERYYDEHNVIEDTEANQSQIERCINSITTRSLEVFKDETEQGIAVKPKKYGKNGAQVMYNWVLLNKASSDSMSNWQQLINIIPQDVMDEGSMYRSILQSADLLGQIVQMADIGYQNSDADEDLLYYLQLRNTAIEARNLLIKYPIEV